MPPKRKNAKYGTSKNKTINASSAVSNIPMMRCGRASDPVMSRQPHQTQTMRIMSTILLATDVKRNSGTKIWWPLEAALLDKWQDCSDTSTQTRTAVTSLERWCDGAIGKMTGQRPVVLSFQAHHSRQVWQPALMNRSDW